MTSFGFNSKVNRKVRAPRIRTEKQPARQGSRYEITEHILGPKQTYLFS